MWVTHDPVHRRQVFLVRKYMLRYSIIHHDVREKHNLSLYEYIVCDSIHQLSHQYPTTKSTRQIGEFVGIDFSTVSRCLITLKEKGLVANVGDGIKTTETWWKEVTDKKRENATTVADSNKTVADSNTLYYKEYKEPNRDKKITPQIQEVFNIFSDNPERLTWRLRPVEREAATALQASFEVDTLKERYKIAKKYRTEEFCPKITKPSELLGKMIDMELFLKRIGKL